MNFNNNGNFCFNFVRELRTVKITKILSVFRNIVDGVLVKRIHDVSKKITAV